MSAWLCQPKFRVPKGDVFLFPGRGVPMRKAHPDPELEPPHLPEQPPIFRNLACCLQPKRNRDDIAIGTKPEGVPKCRSCGWAARFGSCTDDDDATVRCPVDYSVEQPATRMRREEVDVGNGKMGLCFFAHTGTRAELMQCIEDALPDFFYHRWLTAWITWQFKLDIATFDRRSEILVVTGFAALCEMKGTKSKSIVLRNPDHRYLVTLAFRVCIVQVGTCEHGVSCSQLVALVLYLPSEVTAEGAEREVKCDYWRIW